MKLRNETSRRNHAERRDRNVSVKKKITTNCNISDIISFDWNFGSSGRSLEASLPPRRGSGIDQSDRANVELPALPSRRNTKWCYGREDKTVRLREENDVVLSRLASGRCQTVAKSSLGPGIDSPSRDLTTFGPSRCSCIDNDDWR